MAPTVRTAADGADSVVLAPPAPTSLCWRRRSQDTAHTDGADVVVLALKKCISGPPLLPVLGAPGCWEPTHAAAVPLAHYLYELLQRLGTAVPVLNHIDGRTLAPYQAAVRRGDWAQVGAAVAEALKEQRTAYRMQNRGPGSPTIVEVSEPRFEASCGAAGGAPRPPPGLEPPPLSPAAPQPLKVALGARVRSPRCSVSDTESASTGSTLDALSTCSEASGCDVARASPMRLVRSESGELFAARV